MALQSSPVAPQHKTAITGDNGSQRTEESSISPNLSGGVMNSIHARPGQKTVSKTSSALTMTLPASEHQASSLKAAIDAAKLIDTFVERHCSVCELRAEIDIVDGKEDWDSHNRNQHMETVCGMKVNKFDIQIHQGSCIECKDLPATTIDSRKDKSKEPASTQSKPQTTKVDPATNFQDIAIAAPSETQLQIHCNICNKGVAIIVHEDPLNKQRKEIWEPHNREYHFKCFECNVSLPTSNQMQHAQVCSKRKVAALEKSPALHMPNGRPERAKQAEPQNKTGLELCKNCGDWWSTQDQQAFRAHYTSCDQAICRNKECGDVMSKEHILLHVKNCKPRKTHEREAGSARNTSPFSIATTVSDPAAPVKQITIAKSTIVPTQRTGGLSSSKYSNTTHQTPAASGRPTTPDNTIESTKADTDNQASAPSEDTTDTPTQVAGQSLRSSLTTPLGMKSLYQAPGMTNTPGRASSSRRGRGSGGRRAPGRSSNDDGPRPPITLSNSNVSRSAPWADAPKFEGIIHNYTSKNYSLMPSSEKKD